LFVSLTRTRRRMCGIINPSKTLDPAPKMVNPVVRKVTGRYAARDTTNFCHRDGEIIKRQELMVDRESFLPKNAISGGKMLGLSVTEFTSRSQMFFSTNRCFVAPCRGMQQKPEPFFSMFA
jgi:hypothetical protein